MRELGIVGLGAETEQIAKVRRRHELGARPRVLGDAGLEQQNKIAAGRTELDVVRDEHDCPAFDERALERGLVDVARSVGVCDVQ